MAMKRILFLLANSVLLNGIAQFCTEIPGSLKQIDAGNGLVVGLEATGNVFMLNGEDWLYLAGEMKHVTVGTSGVWMVDNGGHIYQLIGGNLVKLPGSFSQIDAGGDLFVAGVNSAGETRCLSSSELVTLTPNSSVSWTNMDGFLRYFSCGQRGCWGTTSSDDVVFRHGIVPEKCQGTSWQTVSSKYSMAEVGSDGSVYAVKIDGNVYRRDGITDSTPTGNRWMKVSNINARVKQLSYDLNILWLITRDDKILRCQL